MLTEEAVSTYQIRGHLASVVTPFLAAAAMGVRYQFANGVTVALLVALALAPVWLAEVRKFSRVPALLLVGLAAVGSGVLLTMLNTSRASSNTLLVAETLTLLSMLGAIGTLLWARTCIGSSAMALAFGLGSLASVALVGGNPANLWKYSLSVPVTIAVLSARRKGGRVFELFGLAALGLVSLSADSRSMAALLVLTAVTVIWQIRPQSGTAGNRRWPTLAALALFTYGAYELLQSLILDGILGEAARARSQAQIDATGSLIAGGRPELGAATALISARWWGYGSGTIPTSSDVSIAKTGMSDLNYDPNNGYVESFMFGGHFEVHSVLGDLWIRFGLPGAILAIALTGYCLLALVRRVAQRTASATAVFVVLLTLWNVLFSPLATSYRVLALAVALLAIPLDRTDARDHRWLGASAGAIRTQSADGRGSQGARPSARSLTG